MAEASRGYFEMEDVTEIVIADLDMPDLPTRKPTDATTLEGAAVAVAERHRDAFLAEAGFTHIPGIELDCSGVVLGDELVGGVPSGGFVDRVTQIGTAPDGTPRLLVEDDKSGKLPRKGDETVHDQLRIYVLMIEKLTGIRPVAARLIYTRFGEFIDVDVSDEALDEALECHEDAWAAHNKQMGKPDAGAANLATKVPALCGWCPAVLSCPAAAAADRVRRRRSPTAGSSRSRSWVSTTRRCSPLAPRRMPRPPMKWMSALVSPGRSSAKPRTGSASSFPATACSTPRTYCRSRCARRACRR